MVTLTVQQMRNINSLFARNVMATGVELEEAEGNTSAALIFKSKEGTTKGPKVLI